MPVSSRSASEGVGYQKVGLRETGLGKRDTRRSNLTTRNIIALICGWFGVVWRYPIPIRQ